MQLKNGNFFDNFSSHTYQTHTWSISETFQPIVNSETTVNIVLDQSEIDHSMHPFSHSLLSTQDNQQHQFPEKCEVGTYITFKVNLSSSTSMENPNSNENTQKTFGIGKIIELDHENSTVKISVFSRDLRSEIYYVTDRIAEVPHAAILCYFSKFTKKGFLPKATQNMTMKYL